MLMVIVKFIIFVNTTDLVHVCPHTQTLVSYLLYAQAFKMKVCKQQQNTENAESDAALE